MKPWTFSNAVEVVIWSYVALIGVLLPAAVVVGLALGNRPYGAEDLFGAAFMYVIIAVGIGIVTLLPAALSLPVSYVLGAVLHGLPSKAAHCVAHGILAGVLAAAALLALVRDEAPDLWKPMLAWTVMVALAAAAGRWWTFRRVADTEQAKAA